MHVARDLLKLSCVVLKGGENRRKDRSCLMGLWTPQNPLIFVRLGAVVLSAFFCAQGTGHVLAARLTSPTQTEAARTRIVPRPVLGSAAHSRHDPMPILQRNIFDSATGPIDPNAKPIDVVEVEAEDPNQPPSPCTGDVHLVAMFYSELQPELSFAVVRSGGDATTLRSGTEVDGRELISAGPYQAVIRNGSAGRCSLQMFAEESPPPPASPPTPKRARPARAAANGKISGEEYDQNISKTSDTAYTVNRSLLNKVLSDRSELMRSARIIPHEENGRVVGVKLYGIRRNSLLGKIGLQNGDMLRTINGYDMASPDSALEAYARLRSADRLSVSIVRRGKAMTMNYTVQ